MAQQAGEKAIKAVILLDNLPFEMTQDLAAIAAQAPSDFANPASTMDLAWLADIETMARYPDEGDTVTSEDAKRAVGIANGILAAAAGHFAARGVDELLIAAS
jgi:HEPN domain-containing protein